MALTRIKAQQISDIDYKQAVRVITLSNTTLAGGAPASVDGITLVANDRILVAGQDTGSQNGLYYVQTLGTGSNGTWARTSDGNETGEIQSGMIVMVTEGDVYKDTQWKLTTNDPIVIGSSNLVFEQNSAFAFGNIVADGTAVLATAVGGVVSFVAGNNIAITGNNTAKSIQFDVTGISLNSISNGTSNVNVISSGGNVTVGVGGTNNIAVFATTGEYVTGVVSVSGNVTGGNLLTSGQVSVTGNISGGNLSITSDAVITGNLTVNGNTTYINSNVVTTNDKSIVLANNQNTQANVNGAGIELGNNSTVVWQYNSTANAWLSNVGISAAGAVTTASDVTATGNITGGNVSTGIISASGNVTGANYLTAGLISATGNITSGNVVTGIMSASGNVAGANYLTAGLISATGNITGGNVHTAIVSASGNVTGANYLTSGLISSTGNITSGNILTSGLVSSQGNVTGSYIFGNGSQMSGINSFGTIKASGESDIVANSINAALTFAAAAGSGLIYTTDAANGVITIDQVSTQSIFATGGDMGLVTQAVTSSEDLGLITDAATVSYDLGSVVSASGLIYPSQLVLPTYTANTLPSANPAAQFVFLSSSSVGAMTAFSDGTNWRFTSTGAIVS